MAVLPCCLPVPCIVPGLVFTTQILSSMLYKRHRIFASGVHRKADPAQAVWPAERVRATFEASKQHSPALIPYTFRHPKNGLPVLGYASRETLELHEDGGKTYLSVVPKELASDFMTGLKSAGFDQVSVGLGKMGEVVHIGVTDASLTAVDGLGPVFEADSVQSVPAVFVDEVVFEADALGGGIESSFEVSWKWELKNWMRNVADLFQSMRDQKIDSEGLDAADRFLPSYVVDMLKRELPQDEPGTAAAFEGDGLSTAERQELDRLRAGEAQRIADAAAAVQASRLASIETFCTDHAEIVTPKIKPVIVALLGALQEAPDSMTFERDGASVSMFDLGCQLLAKLPAQVSFEQDVASGAGPDRSDSDPSGHDPVTDALAAQYAAARQ